MINDQDQFVSEDVLPSIYRYAGQGMIMKCIESGFIVNDYDGILRHINEAVFSTNLRCVLYLWDGRGVKADRYTVDQAGVRCPWRE